MLKWILSLFVFASLPLVAQHVCATDQRMAELMASDSLYSQNRVEIENWMTQFESGQISDNERGDKEFVIPVVIHVLYRLEENNVTMAQIHSQIEALNRDYNLQNSDQSDIPAAFAPYKSSATFRFVLADRDPDGNFTTGVTRTKTGIENIGSTEYYYKTSAGGIDPWPQPFYVNIWVCEIEGLTLGYAYLPAATMSKKDGIVVAPRAFGTMGTAKSPYNLGRTLVHEMGHYFGLMHPWGDEEGSCSNTDHMPDTPTQNGPNNGCKTFPTYSCPDQPNGDMFMNYMDYASDACALLFTENQTSFMRLIALRLRTTLQYSTGYTGLTELENRNDDFWIYPNPTKDYIRIDYNGTVPESMELLNMNGQVMKTWSPRELTERVDLSDLPAGVYYLRTSNDFKRLVVQ